VQWWDLDLTALFSGSPVAAGSALGCIVDRTSVPHAFYISGPNRHVSQWYFVNDAWTPQDLTVLAAPTPPEGAVPSASTETALSCFVDNYGVHVVYVGVDSGPSHVHQLYLSWMDQQLTTTVTVDPGSGLSSFVDASGGAHVLYISSDHHLHQLSFSGGAWTDLDLSLTTRSTTTAYPGSSLASYADGYGYHALYIGKDGHVHQAYFDNVNWSDQDLTSASKALDVAPEAGLAAYSDRYGEHVFYVGSDGHLHQLGYTGGGWPGSWADTDLTKLTGGPQVVNTSALTGFADTFGDHAFYLGVDQDVHQLYFDNTQWVDQDLTDIATPVQESEVPAAAIGSALSSLADAYGEQVLYVGSDQHVHLLCYAPQPLGGGTPSPFVASCPTLNGQVGVPYSSNIAVSGGTPPYSNYVVTTGQLPPGLGPPSSSGVISGTPTTSGQFVFEVTVTDSTGKKVTTGGCAIQIAAPPQIPVSCPTASNGVVGTAYNSSVGIAGGTPAYTYVISGGSLPAGLTLNPATGAITGTPQSAGTSNFTVTVTDSIGATGTANCAITIANPPPFTLTVLNYPNNEGLEGPLGSPFSGLQFSEYPSDQMNFSQVPGGPGVYLISGLSNGTLLQLSPVWRSAVIGLSIVNSQGVVVTQNFPVTNGGSLTIWIQPANVGSF
jgi:hypothetical protein